MSRQISRPFQAEAPADRLPVLLNDVNLLKHHIGDGQKSRQLPPAQAFSSTKPSLVSIGDGEQVSRSNQLRFPMRYKSYVSDMEYDGDEDPDGELDDEEEGEMSRA